MTRRFSVAAFVLGAVATLALVTCSTRGANAAEVLKSQVRSFLSRIAT